MTFALVRAGLPNTIVALALATVPLLALAMTGDKSPQHAYAQGGEPTIVAGPDAAAGGVLQIAE